MSEDGDFTLETVQTLLPGDKAELLELLNSSDLDPHWIVEIERRLDAGSDKW